MGQAAGCQSSRDKLRGVHGGDQRSPQADTSSQIGEEGQMATINAIHVKRPARSAEAVSDTDRDAKGNQI